MRPSIYKDKAEKQKEYRDAVAHGFTKDNGGVKAYRAALAAGLVTPPLSFDEQLDTQVYESGYVNRGWFGQNHDGVTREKATHIASPKPDNMKYVTACGKFLEDVKVVTDFNLVTCGKCRTNSKITPPVPQAQETSVTPPEPVTKPIAVTPKDHSRVPAVEEL